ncbi:MAG TPA: right-handed parallel beta-helix repeat-containing protein [Verrucomicrobiae bacterium]|nr:right-handed parallel beta-helix repeat-containing protein [Verrucomicrobiae bacterium]
MWAAEGASETGPAFVEVSTAGELQAAVARVSKLGGAIRLRPGSYAVDGTIEFKGAHRIALFGSGWSTILKKRGDGDAIRFEGAGFCVVRDLWIRGDKAAKVGSGIVFRNSSSCKVEGCQVTEFPVDGVRLEGDEGRPISSNTVRDCHLLGNREAGLSSVCNNDFYIVGNQFGTHGAAPRAGCVLDRSSAGTYSMNYHWGNVNALRITGGSSFNRLENNRFEESRETAVVMGELRVGGICRYNIFAGNTFHSNSQDKPGEFAAMTASNAKAITFTGNQFFSWNATAYKHRSSLVLGSGCTRWIITGNIFDHNTGTPLLYDGGAQIIVRDNLTDSEQ